MRLGGTKVLMLVEVASEGDTEKGTTDGAASVLDGGAGVEKLAAPAEETMKVFFFGRFFFSLAPCTPWIRISASRRATAASDQQPWRHTTEHVNNTLF